MRATICLLLFVSMPLFAAKIIRQGATISYAETCAGLQAALNAAQGGDIVELRAGTNAGTPYYACGTTTVRIPKHPGAGFVTVRTERFRNLPNGETRVCPPGSLAERLGCAANVGADDLAVVQFEPNFVDGFLAQPGASHWRFVGLEIRGESTIAWSTLFSLGITGSLRDRAHAIEIDRCWIHGYHDQPGPKMGIDADGSAIVVKNSVIEEIKIDGFDSQGIFTRSGPGPLTVTNSFLAGGAENFFTGGAWSRQRGAIPALITFAGNFSTLDPRWWRSSSAANPSGSCISERLHRNTATSAWWRCVEGAWQLFPCGGEGQPACPRTNIYTVLKNLFEFKAIKTARIEGNVFDGHWVLGQTAAILIFNGAVGQNGYTFSLADVDFRFNRISRTPTAFTVGVSSSPLRGLRVAHNLFDSVMEPERGDGARYVFQNVGRMGSYGLTIRNNTVSNSTRGDWTFGLYSSVGSPLCPYCQFLDNVLPWNSQPITGDSQPTAATFFGTSGWYAWAHGRAAGNVFSLNGRNPVQHYRDAIVSPPCCGGNSIATAEADVLDAGLKVKPPYRGTATDGGDSGADIDTVNAMTAGAVSGAANPYLRFRLGSWLATATGATIWYTAPTGPERPEGTCTVRASSPGGLATAAGEVSEIVSGTARMATIMGLNPGTVYYVSVACGGATRRGSFRTRTL